MVYYDLLWFTMIYYDLLWFTMIYYDLLLSTIVYYSLLWLIIVDDILDLGHYLFGLPSPCFFCCNGTAFTLKGPAELVDS